MISSDPQRRAVQFDAVLAALHQLASPGDRDLLLAFGRITLPQLPDALVLRLDPPALAARIAEYFRFVVHTMPPPVQLYKGLPGLHVSVHNPGVDEDVTIIDTHTADVPFIFESLKNYCQKQALRVFSAVHPMFSVRRQWERIVWIGDATDDGARESYCQFRVERVEAKDRLRRIEHQVHAVLKSVFLAVEDFPAMKRAAVTIGSRLRSRREEAGEVETAHAFINWLVDDNYVLLGMMRYRARLNAPAQPEQESALGVFKDPALLPVVFPGLMQQDARVESIDRDDCIIELDYSPGASAIHHLEPLDDFLIREWTPDGQLASATLVVGRLAKSAFSARPQEMPLLREKLKWLLEHVNAAPGTHAYRETRAIFNSFPKRELLYSTVAAIKEIVDRMVQISGDDEIAVTTRQGNAYNAVNIAFSEVHYSHTAEEQLKERLAAEFGPISFSTWADTGRLAVLVFYFDRATLEHPIDVERVTEIVHEVITTWEDRTSAELDREFGPTEGRRLFRKYVRAESRSGLYRETTPPEEVPEDVRRFEQLEDRLEARIMPKDAGTVVLKLFSPTPLELIDTLRTLEHLGLTVREEMAMPLVLPQGRTGFLQRVLIEADPPVIKAMIDRQADMLDALRALHEGRATNDPLNGLILKEGLGWREVEVLRTLRNHLLQIRTHYTVDTVTSVMLRNSRVAASIFALFAARLDPAVENRDPGVDEADDQVRDAFRGVANLVDDEVLRAIENLVRAALRTNFYQRPERPVLSIKVESRKVEGMVSPRPLYEIYVHSRLLEGIHLRGGKVARGGIRWSDRHDDFRTEVLGLMKTQMLKNAIIVPVGSKGGFVLKGTLPPRPGLDAYLVDRYREFVSGLLDVTDNLVDGTVVHPPSVVRHDEDDPYLVVAADKGTAHLSDTANHVSAQYGFWLGDAFASGGSNGYDHKKEAITARGAWCCVQHHFRTLGVDVQREPFTVVGIGDMSGDVFGNGLLRSRTTKLVGAFNHQHIFLDPDPDPERSFVERERLFNLPRSSWQDYDRSVLSPAGGIYDRQAKDIPLSPEVRKLLEIDAESASGEEVIRRMLCARVDLLYNGGIGTYIKASTEEDTDVGDRTNDRVRVDAVQVRARVIAEGGNLGLTQQGRIEYWMGGGCINTDAVDNSGGVDMSDHEVNIKILLDVLLQKGLLHSRDERNGLLQEMTDEVSELVLADNILQSRALSLDGLRSAAAYKEFVSLVEVMIATGVMDRNDDEVPMRDDLMASPARDRGLPRPLLAVMMAHAKTSAYSELLRTPVLDSASVEPFLINYFPSRLGSRFASEFKAHPLRREIAGTTAVNYLINHAGVSFLPRVTLAADKDLGTVVQAYLDVDRKAGAADLRARILASGMDVHREHEALVEIEEAIEAAVRATLDGAPPAPIAKLDALRATVG